MWEMMVRAMKNRASNILSTVYFTNTRARTRSQNSDSLFAVAWFESIRIVVNTNVLTESATQRQSLAHRIGSLFQRVRSTEDGLSQAAAEVVDL